MVSLAGWTRWAGYCCICVGSRRAEKEIVFNARGSATESFHRHGPWCVGLVLPLGTLDSPCSQNRLGFRGQTALCSTVCNLGAARVLCCSLRGRAPEQSAGLPVWEAFQRELLSLPKRCLLLGTSAQPALHSPLIDWLGVMQGSPHSLSLSVCVFVCVACTGNLEVEAVRQAAVRHL